MRGIQSPCGNGENNIFAITFNVLHFYGFWDRCLCAAYITSAGRGGKQDEMCQRMFL